MRALVFLISIILATGVWAQTSEPIPSSRFVFSPDTDLPGSDITQIFDTTQSACARACQADQSCVAFTYNQTSSACFPKSSAGERVPFVGAISATRVFAGARQRATAQARADAMPYINQADIRSARALADEMATRYPGGQQSAPDLAAAIAQAISQKRYPNARVWAGFLVSATDTAGAWQQFSELSLRLPKSVPSRDRRQAQRESVPAALNGVLRAGSKAEHAATLVQLATALETNGRGRDMIPALRQAYLLTERRDISERLDAAIAKYGFRITDHQVDNDSATPRVCVQFSEPLVENRIDYDIYIRASAQGLVSQAVGSQLCIDGVVHGTRYAVTFRSGLPSSSGEELARDTDVSFYVRDRAPSVRFPGRAYVLPKLAGAALPIETVNLATVDLALRTVSDRNVLRAIQDNYFGRPLSKYEDDIFANEVGEEIWTGTADVQNSLNRDTTTRLPLDEMLKGRNPGIYALTARVPGADPFDDAGATQWFVHTDLGISSFQGSSGLAVAVRSLTKSQAKQGATVSLVSNANAVLAETQTDADGFADFPIGAVSGKGASAPGMIVVKSANDLAFLSLTGPGFDLSDRGVEGRAAPGLIDVFLATDRGAYRPGKTVGVTALMRDDVSNALPNLPLTATLKRPDGAQYAAMTAQQSAAGGHVFQMPIGVDAPTGTWRLDVSLGDGDILASQTLLVEEFLPERLDAELAVTNGPLTLTQSPLLQVKADYLFGAPAADLSVQAELRLKSTRELDAWPGFQFGRHDTPGRQRVASAAPARTDANGGAILSLSYPETSPQHALYEAIIVAQVSEGSGRPVERSLNLPVRPSTALIGLKPGFADFVPEGSNAAFQVVSLDADGTVQARSVTWQLNKVDTRYQWYQLYGNWNWEPTTRRTRVATGSLELGAEPASIDVAVSGWGEYELVVETVDGSYADASQSFFVGWYGGGADTDTPDRLQVGLDKQLYRTGDTATALVTTTRGGTALVSVLGSKVLDRRVVELGEGETRIPLTVTDAWGSGAYVTISLLRAVSFDDPSPSRALGVSYARVDPKAKKLSVSIDAPDTTDGQSGFVDVAVNVDGFGDRFVTLAAVDVGIQNLTAHSAPDAAEYYFGQRRLGVALRDLYGRLIDGQSGALGRVRSGGDADARVKMQSPPPTEAPMVFFSGLVPVDDSGIARIRVPKPAFNGSIRLDAVAWSDQAVGNASKNVIARDPIVLTASAPRFLAPGDISRLLLEFVHVEGAIGAMPLSIRANGLVLSDVPNQVTMRAASKTVVEIPIVARDVGDHEITVSLDVGDGIVLQKTLNLGVRLNDPETSATRRFSLAPGETFRFDSELLTGYRGQTAKATLSAGPLARLDIAGLVTQLDRYPYGCTEQITSGALPLLYLSGFAEGVDTKERIDGAIARILSRQTSAGSFGLWRAQSGEFWLDAYVSDFLIQAQDAGFVVPTLAIDLALQNLQNRINYAPDFDTGGDDIAYALLVLAKLGKASVADLRYYADAKADAFSSPRAAAQLGAALANYGDSLRADRLFQIAVRSLEKQSETRTWRADFGSPVSDRAAVMRLGLDAGSSVVDAWKLSDGLRNLHQTNTQDAAQLLLAAHSLEKSQSPVGITLDGAATNGPVAITLSAGQSARSLQNTSSDPIDVTIAAFGVPEIPSPANGNGYAIRRAYYATDGTPISDPVDTGDQFVVVLTVTPFEDGQARLMIEDPLPAGLEIDNPNLILSGQIQQLDWLKPSPTQNAEFLADRFRAAVDIRGTDPIQVAYKVRAVSPGDFHHPAASVQDMYRPAKRAITDTGRWIVSLK